MSSGIKNIVDANPSDLNKTGDKVSDNLDTAFKTHEENIKNLTSNHWSFASKDIASFLCVCGIEMATALLGTPLWGSAAGIAGISGATPNMRE